MPEPILKRWRAVHNVQLPVPAKVWGMAFRFGDNLFRWDPRDGEELPAQSIVQSGSILEIALTPAKENDWLLKKKAIAPLDANLHFNLEDVFGEDAAKALHFSNIWTLEDVLANKMGNVYTGSNFTKISAATMIKQLANGNADLIAAWMDDARKIVQSVSPEQQAIAIEAPK